MVHRFNDSGTTTERIVNVLISVSNLIDRKAGNSEKVGRSLKDLQTIADKETDEEDP